MADTVVRPSFTANGLFGWMGKHGRHILFGSPVAVQGGDYGAQDQDLVGGPGSGGAAQAYPEAVVLVSPAGVPYSAVGGTSGGGAPYASTPLGYVQVPAATLTAGSVALSPPVGATYAVIEPEAGSVRYRDDGVALTGAVGMPLAAGAVLTIGGGTDLAAIKFTAATGQNPILNISYYK